MKIAIVAAGFAPAEADKLRRAMATFRRVGTIHTFRRKMIDGMAARGYDPDFAERCFRQIEGFGEYGFPESHAASFALLVYASCWLKCHYPDVFTAAILNSQPMGFYAPSQLVRDAREHGVTMLPPDINLSDHDSRLVPPDSRPAPGRRLHPRHADMAGDIRSSHAVRLGLRQIKGIGRKEAERIMQARGAGYDSVRDLWLRTGLSRGAIEHLADADAFRSIGLDRRQALWAAKALDAAGASDRLPLFDRTGTADPQREVETRLPRMPESEHVIQDYRHLSLSLKGHPVGFLREELARRRIIACRELEGAGNGAWVSIAGLVIIRQRPGSARGVVFMTLEDETGVANAIVWPKIMEKFRTIILGARFMRLSGQVQTADNVTHLVVRQVEDFTPLMQALTEKPGEGDCELARIAGGDATLGTGGLANADEIRRPVIELRHRARRNSALSRLLTDAPELRKDFEQLAKSGNASLRKALPKGRNFQ